MAVGMAALLLVGVMVTHQAVVIAEPVVVLLTVELLAAVALTCTFPSILVVKVEGVVAEAVALAAGSISLWAKAVVWVAVLEACLTKDQMGVVTLGRKCKVE
jgi:hypothetical protein